MIVYLDDERIDDHPTLRDAMAAARDTAVGRGRVIIEVHADGEPAPPEDIDDPPDDDAYADELKFVTAEPKTFVRVTMLEAADALEQARRGNQRASEMLQTGETVAAMDDLKQALSAWDAVRRVVVEGCALLGVSLTSKEGLGADAQTIIDELAEQLANVKRAIVDQDWATLSDLLAYELDEQAETWRGELVRMADAITA